MNSQVRLARIAGVYYLVVAIFAGFAQIVRQNVYVPDDAAATAANVMSNADLVRFSFVADLVQATFALFLVLALFRLLQHVNRGMARAMVVFVVLQVGITCLNLVHQLAALLVATEPSYQGTFGAGQGNALVLLLMDMQHSGFLIAQIFFGLWLFPLGWLAYRSGLFPRPLAVALMVATVAYVVDVPLQFLAPDLAAAVSPIVVVPLVTFAEVSMVVYLLIRGVRTPPSDPKAPIGPASQTHPLVNASSHPDSNGGTR